MPTEYLEDELLLKSYWDLNKDKILASIMNQLTTTNIKDILDKLESLLTSRYKEVNDRINSGANNKIKTKHNFGKSFIKVCQKIYSNYYKPILVSQNLTELEKTQSENARYLSAQKQWNIILAFNVLQWIQPPALKSMLDMIKTKLAHDGLMMIVITPKSSYLTNKSTLQNYVNHDNLPDTLKALGLIVLELDKAKLQNRHSNDIGTRSPSCIVDNDTRFFAVTKSQNTAIKLEASVYKIL